MVKSTEIKFPPLPTLQCLIVRLLTFDQVPIWVPVTSVLVISIHLICFWPDRRLCEHIFVMVRLILSWLEIKSFWLKHNRLWNVFLWTRMRKLSLLLGWIFFDRGLSLTFVWTSILFLWFRSFFVNPSLQSWLDRLFMIFNHSCLLRLLSRHYHFGRHCPWNVTRLNFVL